MVRAALGDQSEDFLLAAGEVAQGAAFSPVPEQLGHYVRIAAAFALAAFALIGAGMLAFAVTAAREHAAYRAWAVYTIVVALTLLVLAWLYAAGNGSLSDLLLTADGLLLLPLWLMWTGRLGGIGPESRARRDMQAHPN